MSYFTLNTNLVTLVSQFRIPFKMQKLKILRLMLIRLIQFWMMEL